MHILVVLDADGSIEVGVAFCSGGRYGFAQSRVQGISRSDVKYRRLLPDWRCYYVL